MEVNVLKSNELSNYLIPSNLSKVIERNKNNLKVSLNERVIISYVDNNDYEYKIEIDKNYNIVVLVYFNFILIIIIVNI